MKERTIFAIMNKIMIKSFKGSGMGPTGFLTTWPEKLIIVIYLFFF